MPNPSTGKTSLARRFCAAAFAAWAGVVTYFYFAQFAPHMDKLLERILRW